MDERIKNLINRIKALLAKTYGQKIRKVILYGSYVRGQATRDSDIDILVLVDESLNPSEIRESLSDLLFDILLEEGELVLLTPLLKSGTIESESENIITEVPDSALAFDSLEKRVSQRLEEVNGTDVNTRNIPTGDLAGERPQRAGRPEGPDRKGRGDD